MSTSANIATPAEADTMALARKRLEELVRNLGPRLPADVRPELLDGMEAILNEVLSQHFARRADADDFMSTADAARLLFVSPPHVAKLIEQGKLKLHHKAGNNCFVLKASVLGYQADQQAAMRAYQASAGEEE
ncbi:helix-turn-helix domain-containing protein [Caballeronia sp. RCC_10]|uniref:helix-turn-helix domain-containing protein n=1 Tax=Caballeronia sp. RCC_10 TaxID=3239227 RepID=UPI00352644B2